MNLSVSFDTLAVYLSSDQPQGTYRTGVHLAVILSTVRELIRRRCGISSVLLRLEDAIVSRLSLYICLQESALIVET